MSTAELSSLEAQVDALMRSLENVRVENQILRNKLTVSLRERTRLSESNQKAITKIKRTILQLKEELS